MFQNSFYKLLKKENFAFEYVVHGERNGVLFSWPQFEIDGIILGCPQDMREICREDLNEYITEIVYIGNLWEDISLVLILRASKMSPIFRFRYVIQSEKSHYMTKKDGEKLAYFAYHTKDSYSKMEVRFSDYDYLIHGYQLMEIPAFETEDQIMGPILTEQRGDICMLTAYEHGSQYPDKFVVFERATGNLSCEEMDNENIENNIVVLHALRGNYWAGRSIKEQPYETIWLQTGAVKGNGDDLAKAYREFQLKYCTLNKESRKPHIFYNTWAFQERNKFYNKKTYLASMNQERIEAEIEIAHRMGVDIFVIDTGWYQKTGDWEVDVKKFPYGMERIREKLENYNMKLGLWFNPTVAARTSQLMKKYPNCVSAQEGKEIKALPVWETEESYPMCLVTEYWKEFADYLIFLADKIGVRYFKWDAIDLYGCDRRDHFHGGSENSLEESSDCYAFQIGLYMSKIVDRVCKSYPDVIVDVDITEGRRYFGLGFLSSGKYFSMNNGPYFADYDIEVADDIWTNIFVHPGAARGWICRQNLCYDKWIPSVLMMAHYLPDDPVNSQLINLGSLILGQNGIWGDLLALSEEGIDLFQRVLCVYKQVKDDVTDAFPVVLGKPGSTLEVHEKLSKNGRGVVVLFANLKGSYTYKIQNIAVVQNVKIFGDAEVLEKDGQMQITAKFEKAGAVIVFFGTEQ